MTDNLLTTIGYSLRRLRKNPGFTLTAVLIVALGIGANAIVYSMLNALLFQPLPYPDSHQLVVVFGRSNGGRAAVSYLDLQDWKADAKAFSELSGWSAQSVTLTGQDEPARITGTMAEWNYLRMVGVQPVIGRDFRPGEDEPGAAAGVVLSDKFWQNRLGGDRSTLGRTLILNGIPHTVIGILPAGFALPFSESDVLMPLPSYPNYSRDRGARSIIAIGRLKPGVTPEQSQAELDTIASRLEREYPNTNKGVTARVEGMQEMMVESIRPALRILMAAVAFVLLLVCANLANLMLTKAMGRSREISIRASLGASRWNIIGQLLSEGAVVSALGCIGGVALAAAALRLLESQLASQLPAGVHFDMSGPVLGFTVVLAMAVGLVSAAIPALRVSGGQWNDALRQRDSSGGTRGHNRIRQVLVAAQIAVATVLIVGTALLAQSFLRLQGVNPGYRPDGLLTMEYRLPKTKYPTNELLTATHLRIVEAVRATPGVRSAGLIRALPFSGNGMVLPFSLADKPEPAPADRLRARFNATDTDAFRTMEIPLLRGRVFSSSDRLESAPVVVINEAMARRFWPGDDPIGRQLRIPPGVLGSGTTVATIVGVVGDIKHDRLDDREALQIYSPIAQMPFVFSSLVVRTEGDPMSMARTVQRAVWSVDKDQPVWKVQTLDTMIDRSLSNRRLIAGLIAAFSGVAMLLAAIGLYGVVAYSVAQRTSEMGVRMALGATPGNLIGLVLREGVLLGVAGAALGAVLAIVSTRLLESQLYGIRPTDPMTHAVVIGGLLFVAAAASVVPAVRAARVDPAAALRSE